MADKKCPKCPPEGAADWLLSWGDLNTLLLTFFVMMFSAAEIDGYQIKLLLAAFSGLGIERGGNTLSPGKLVELGNTVMSLPSMDKGRGFAKARNKAISQFQPEIASKKVRVQEDERGLVITLAADAFFRPGSADVDIEESRGMLVKLANLLTSDDLKTSRFRIEGHTDNTVTDPKSRYPTNWELSAMRAVNVLHVLKDYGADEKKFQVAGLADTRPLVANDTEEGRAYNRRVDIIILSDGHL
jgi:chemotaxis protein MotB